MRIKPICLTTALLFATNMLVACNGQSSTSASSDGREDIKPKTFGGVSFDSFGQIPATGNGKQFTISLNNTLLHDTNLKQK